MGLIHTGYATDNLNKSTCLRHRKVTKTGAFDSAFGATIVKKRIWMSCSSTSCSCMYKQVLHQPNRPSDQRQAAHNFCESIKVFCPHLSSSYIYIAERKTCMSHESSVIISSIQPDEPQPSTDTQICTCLWQEPQKNPSMAHIHAKFYGRKALYFYGSRGARRLELSDNKETPRCLEYW